MADSKIYDGTVASSQTPTVTGLNTAAGDQVNNLSQVFASKDVLGAGLSTLQVAPGYTITDSSGLVNESANYTVATNTASGTISAADTSLSLVPSDPKPVYGEALTITATVAAVAPGGGTPTGSVVFAIDQGVSVVEPLTNGVATLSIPVPGPSPSPVVGGSAASCAAQGLRVGPNTITAVYQPDTADFNGTTQSLSLPVAKAGTTTTLTSSVDNSTTATPYGHPILFTATITVTAPGGGIPCGWVVFEDTSNNDAVLGKPA